MDNVFHSIPNVGCYIDDVIVAGKSFQDYKTTLENVLHRLAEFNITLKEEKCKIFQESVVYLGHEFMQVAFAQLLRKSKLFLKHPSPRTAQS